VQLGQQVNMNSAMLAIIPLDDIWVDANYKESSLENIRIGQSVSLYADAYSGAHFHGKIMGLNAGTGSAFSLLPPQNATGNWIKIVQRLPVRIQLDAKELKKTPLQIGLSMRVTTNIKNLNGSRLADNTEPKLDYKTSVYKQQLAHIEPIINTILQENSLDMFLPRVNS
jgi:membrane fusion protein, multidrug efflux system